MNFFKSAYLIAALISQFAPASIAAPAINSTQEVYIGVFAPDKTYAQDVYVILPTIRVRGDLRRFQEHQIYRQQQNSAFGYSYKEVISYRVVNCREGTSGMLRTIEFNSKGNQVNDSTSSNFQLTIPEPDSINEKSLDFVCEYKK